MVAPFIKGAARGFPQNEANYQVSLSNCATYEKCMQGWKFCIFGQPGCEQKKAQEPKTQEEGKKEEMGREKKKRRGVRRKDRGKSRKKGATERNPPQKRI